jgi:hypothetical protein
LKEALLLMLQRYEQFFSFHLLLLFPREYTPVNSFSHLQTMINKFKQSMMYELFGLKDNRGSLPSVYVQTIDD